MLSKFQQEYGVDFKERADALNLTTDEVITLASIIEREGKHRRI
jgi:cell division protein YceG involved in septum cleavage